MKKAGWIILPLAVLAAAAAGWLWKTQIVDKQTEEVVEEDGGYDSYSGPDKLTNIVSEEIVSFECEFSTISFMETDTWMENAYYRLKAVLNDNTVKGTYICSSRTESLIETEFETDLTFMEQLQEIVKEHNLAGMNGLSINVSGLPEMYGACLDVQYASGESIWARDNQDNFLTIACMESLAELFAGK